MYAEYRRSLYESLKLGSFSIADSFKQMLAEIYQDVGKTSSILPRMQFQLACLKHNCSKKSSNESINLQQTGFNASVLLI